MTNSPMKGLKPGPRLVGAEDQGPNDQQPDEGIETRKTAAPTQADRLVRMTNSPMKGLKRAARVLPAANESGPNDQQPDEGIETHRRDGVAMDRSGPNDQQPDEG